MVGSVRAGAVVALCLLLAAPAAGQQVRQTQSPAAGDGLAIPDMRDLQREWGHATVAAEAARVVEQIGDLPTASRKLWDAHLSEVTFPVEVHGAAAEWFEVVSPLQEVDVSEAGLRALWGAFPSQVLRRDRLAVACVDDTGMTVGAPLLLGGPDEVLPSGTSVLYTLDNVDDCWTAGGVRLVVHDVEIDPLAAIAASPSKEGDMARWGERHRRDVLSISVLQDGEGVSGLFAEGGLTDAFVGDAWGLRDPPVEEAVGGLGHLDCSVAGKCPSNADCGEDELCSCDDHGNVVTRDFDRDGCPEQRASFVYDEAGRVKVSHHDWDNDGDVDQRCVYDPPCRLRGGDCKKSCGDLKGR